MTVVVQHPCREYIGACCCAKSIIQYRFLYQFRFVNSIVDTHPIRQPTKLRFLDCKSCNIRFSSKTIMCTARMLGNTIGIVFFKFWIHNCVGFGTYARCTFPKTGGEVVETWRSFQSCGRAGRISNKQVRAFPEAFSNHASNKFTPPCPDVAETKKWGTWIQNLCFFKVHPWH